jgi:two-component system sensor histidine kinase QseC
VISSLRQSLSQRLLMGLIAVSVAYTLGIAWLTVRDSVDEVYELFDAHLAQTALALLRVTDPDEEDKTTLPTDIAAPDLGVVFASWPELPQRLSKVRGAGAGVVVGSIQAMRSQYERSLRYQVWSSNGQLLLRSANAPEKVLTSHDGLSESTELDGQAWKYYAVWDRHHDFRIVVSEDYDLRNRLVRSIAMRVVSPLGLGLPVLLLLIWLSIRQGLWPLGRLAQEIEARKPDSLMPLENAQVPNEVRPLVDALNHLLERIGNSLEGERRFTANAAHELRTPLAAIQAQAYLVRTAESEADRLDAVAQLQRGIARAMRLVGQMLTMARLDPEQALPAVLPMDLNAVAKSVCADLAPLALQRNQTLELHAGQGLPALHGNADMVSMLISNLVDNAIRYTPMGGNIRVGLCIEEGCICLRVEDDGPGIPLHLRERVFERFYRVANAEQVGTGLGLAICQRIAALHGATIRLQGGAQGTGTCAVVCIAPMRLQGLPV